MIKCTVRVGQQWEYFIIVWNVVSEMLQCHPPVDGAAAPPSVSSTQKMLLLEVKTEITYFIVIFI